MSVCNKRGFALLLCFMTVPAWAQLTIPQEYDKTIKATNSVGALGNDLFGEQTSLYTGSTSFNAVDVSLPGNNGLAVEIRRRFTVTSTAAEDRPFLVSREGGFADWELDLPYLQGIYALGHGWQAGDFGPSDQRCSSGASEAPMADGSFGGLWAGPEYWHGNSLNVPGGGSQEMLGLNGGNLNLPTDGSNPLWITNSQWVFSCLTSTANGVAGDAFLGRSPDGVRYTFNWIVTRRAPSLIKDKGPPVDWLSEPEPSKSPMTPMSPVGDKTSLSREEVRIYPTRIEDRFGNYVTYTYDPAKPWRLTSIVASDGRSLTLAYNASGHISTVTDGTRTWTYIYGSGLTEVRLPDQSKWLISFANLRNAYTDPDPNVTFACDTLTAKSNQITFVGTITHPSGAVGSFSFKSTPHGRSYVPKHCVYPDPNSMMSNYARVPFLFSEVALQQKQISGPGLATATWTYTYGTPNNSWLENCGSGCTSTKTLVVDGPGSDWARYTYGNRYQYNEGLLLKVERGSGPSAILSVEDSVYQHDSTGQAYPALIGFSSYSRGDHMAEKFMPLKQKTTTQQGRTFSWQVSSTCGGGSSPCFDLFARPTKVVKSSSP
jgi:YD repeat-containing protein